MFGKISSILVGNDNSWSKKAFLTFDIDWATDEVLQYCIELIGGFDIEATWFVTHSTPLLREIAKNKKWEIGIHPNFNFLLNGDYSKGKNIKEIVSKILELAPDAKSVRSHCITQSSPILDMFAQFGLSHECNHFIPSNSQIIVKPWIHWNNLIRVPYIWEDDVYIMYNKNNLPEESPANLFKCSTSVNLNVYNFHPIHVFLNTESMERYESTRDLHQKPKDLINHRFMGCGIYNLLVNLINSVKGSRLC